MKKKSKKTSKSPKTLTTDINYFFDSDSDCESLVNDISSDIDWEIYLNRHQQKLFRDDRTDSISPASQTPVVTIPRTPIKPATNAKKKVTRISHRIYKLPRTHNFLTQMVENFESDTSDRENVRPMSQLSVHEITSRVHTHSTNSLNRRLSVGEYSTDGRRFAGQESVSPECGEMGGGPLRIANSPSLGYDGSAASSTKSLRCSRSSSPSSRTSLARVDPEVECARYMHPPEVPRSNTEDWLNAPALQLALNGEDDNFPSDLTDVITKVCKNDDGKASKILEHFQAAMRLLLQLHRELRCPPTVHRSFWEAHCVPSYGNLATVLTRVIYLSESRCTACTGNPSPKLVARILEESKAKEQSKNTDVEMFSRLNFFGQSSTQIRARAGATILSLRQHQAVTNAQDNDERLVLTSLTRVVSHDSSDDDDANSKRGGFRRISQRKPRSSVIRSLESLSRDDSHSDEEDDIPIRPRARSGTTREGTVSQPILKPSEILRIQQSKSPDAASGDKPALPSSLAAITENDEDDDDDDEEGVQEALLLNGSTELERRETIKKFVQARFSGRISATTDDVSTEPGRPPEERPSFCRATSAPLPATTQMPPPPRLPPDAVKAAPGTRRVSSKRMSCMNVHPQLLQTISHEWMASVPWHIPVFVFGGRVIATSPGSS